MTDVPQVQRRRALQPVTDADGACWYTLVELGDSPIAESVVGKWVLKQPMRSPLLSRRIAPLLLSTSGHRTRR